MFSKGLLKYLTVLQFSGYKQVSFLESLFKVKHLFSTGCKKYVMDMNEILQKH